MTEITEKQSYLMGWTNCTVSEPIDPCGVMWSLTPPEINDTVRFQELVDVYRVPDYSLLDAANKLHFLRGVIDRIGLVCDSRIELPVTDLVNIDELVSLLDVKCDRTNPEVVVWNGINAVELFVTLYSSATCYENKHHRCFQGGSFKWAKSLPDAVQPTKNRPSDTGFDLTVVSKIKEVGNVSYYDTGIKVQPSNGYYFEVVGRSSISKTGWMMANNIGIIDASYRGSIIIALVRVNPDADEITLPMRIAQMIPRKLIHMCNHEVDESELDDTTRGDSGFGSSG